MVGYRPIKKNKQERRSMWEFNAFSNGYIRWNEWCADNVFDSVEDIVPMLKDMLKDGVIDEIPTKDEIENLVKDHHLEVKKCNGEVVYLNIYES